MSALARPGGDIVALDEAARRYRTTSGYAPKTLREYGRWFRRFTDSCAPADVWKADHRDVRRWFVFLAQSVKPQSVEVACAALTAN
ncbi:phage integrase N-terminal SAM-like domain-containing protein [Jannaschia sp. 2305UL9-9]|uniref:phage integrase N-terminal SAM-like domain-containing protein n=1 Tax=Jannaschia sp. 2305UL9-9 TaxID=3121638 RepID=UPI00352866FF